ncbi:glycoside hydrolase family 9 protein [Hyphomonas beringensis]|uniref:glycoside hydrolase family 9 protein n=1 Tax=Hyphomonas beringensis TaxID=1280946 RepID=UPI00068F7AEB|nr:glycoside hydrolase family 9 protein [Hyphomonas beringensis]
MFTFCRTGLTALASVVLLAACSTTDTGSSEASGASGRTATPIGKTRQQEYLEAFNAPRGKVRATQTGIRPGYNFVGIAETDITYPLPWEIMTKDGTIVASGMTVPYGLHEGSGEPIHLIIANDLTTRGKGLVLQVKNVGESHPFDVSEDVFRDLKYDMLSYFYHNRAGMPIEAKYAGGEQWSRPAGHENEVLTCFNGIDKAGIKWPGCHYRLDVTGGWYDAGDHGKYVVDSGISVWTLLDAYERGAKGFADGEVNIPEAGNGENDLLDEARYNIDFMMSMQAPDNAHAAVLLGDVGGDLANAKPEVIDVSGMVHHKAGDTSWASFPLMPHMNTKSRALFPPSTAATLHLAAVGAQCARVFRGIDDAYADKCLKASERAYAAAKRVPDAYAHDNFQGTGPYSSNDLRSEFYWAAAELYVTTGEAGYQADVKASQAKLDHWPLSSREEINWHETEGLGIITLARFSPDAEMKAQAIEGLKSTADGYTSQIIHEGYQIPINRGVWPWGSIGTLANRGLLLGTAYDLTGDTRYRNAALDLLDYILGRNPRDISYVSGHGENAVKALHHRFWAGAYYPGYPLPPAGVVSGGPNNTNPSGPVSRTIIEQCHAQTCFVDHNDAYELNGVGINIQAATFWLAAWADDIDRAN